MLLGMAVGGCVENESLVVLGSPLFEAAEGCQVNAQSDTYAAFGTLDLAFGTPYYMPATVRSQLITSEATNSGIQDGEVQLRGADIELAMPQAPEILAAVAARDPAFTRFSWPLPNLSVPPGSRVGVIVPVISGPTAVALSEEIAAQLDNSTAFLTLEANVRFTAFRSGDNNGKAGIIEARGYRFPIQVCNTCMLRCACLGVGMACPSPEDALYVGGVCGSAQETEMVLEECSEEAGN